MRRNLATILALLGSATALAGEAANAAAAKPLRPDQAAFFDLYRELVETNTTFSAGDCTRAATQLQARLQTAGFTSSELHPYLPEGRPRDGGLVVIWPGTKAAAPAMLLLAHIDVVEANREDWVRDPFKLVEEDGYYYGRGAMDDKSQAAIFTDTLIRLKKSGFKPRRTMKLALTCGEEGSNPKVLNGAGWLVENRPEQLKAAFALNEGGSGQMAPDGSPRNLGVQIGEKAPRNFAVEAVNPGGHSSTPVPENAIYQLSTALLKLRDLRFPLHFNPVTKAYFAKTGALRNDAMGAAMRSLAANPDDKSAEAIVSADRAFNSMLRTTCVATLLTAGHAINALPQRATASVNCRIVPGETAESVQETLIKAIADPGVTVTRLTAKERTLAVPPPLDPKILGPMERIAARIFPGVPVVPMQSTGATDATHLARLGIPTYGIPGLWNDPATSGMHGLNERVPIEVLYRGRDYMFELIKYYGEQEE